MDWNYYNSNSEAENMSSIVFAWDIARSPQAARKVAKEHISEVVLCVNNHSLELTTLAWKMSVVTTAVYQYIFVQVVG